MYFKKYMLHDQRENLSEILLTAGKLFIENCKVAPKRKVIRAVHNSYKIKMGES